MPSLFLISTTNMWYIRKKETGSLITVCNSKVDRKLKSLVNYLNQKSCKKNKKNTLYLLENNTFVVDWNIEI